MSGHPIFAAIYDRALVRAERGGLGELRAELLRPLAGRVLEIGAGTGLNLGRYPEAVAELVLAEPDPHMARRLRARLAAEPPGFPATVVEAAAETLPFADASFDIVVSTLVLCSVADPSRATAEIARVLAPGGELRLIEHVRDPESERRARWQDRLERPWGWFTGACHPNRDTAATLVSAGFDLSQVESDVFPAAGPLVEPLIRGAAIRPSA